MTLAMLSFSAWAQRDMTYPFKILDVSTNLIEEGKWYVINRSELGSTYLEANRKLAIEPGDVLVLGDRRFKFEAE